jgi:hypothetical protein
MAIHATALTTKVEQLIIPIGATPASGQRRAADAQLDGTTIAAGELQLQDKHGEPVLVYSSHLLLRNSHGLD